HETTATSAATSITAYSRNKRIAGLPRRGVHPVQRTSERSCSRTTRLIPMAASGHQTQITRGALARNRTDTGPPDGEPVLLLHGFPQRSDSWDALVPLLVEAGYRTLAMDQRGYSPGARPVGRAAYRMTELVADAAAVIDHYGGSAHVVGHDWGAAVAWA